MMINRTSLSIIILAMLLLSGCATNKFSNTEREEALVNAIEFGIGEGRVNALIDNCKDLACSEVTSLSTLKGIESNFYIIGRNIKLDKEKSSCRADTQDDTASCTVKGEAPMNMMVDKVNEHLYEAVTKTSSEVAAGTYTYELVFANEEGESKTIEIDVTVS